jgi:hypothetical protein
LSFLSKIFQEGLARGFNERVKQEDISKKILARKYQQSRGSITP